jgi:prolyl oligopeptidase
MRPLAPILMLASVAAAPTEPAEADALDWAEEVEGARAMAHVGRWNARTRQRLEASPGFALVRARAAAILNDPRQIAYGQIAGSDVLNFWQDAANPRGMWRAAPLSGYLADAPRWRALLDLGALARAEGRNWVWKGAVCRPTDGARCLVALSDGGADAVELREFDLASARFVAGGFRLPAAKQTARWLDDDTLLVQSDFGPGTLTRSGYGRQVRRLTRGTELRAAPVVAEGTADDVGVSPIVERDGGRSVALVQRARDFWTSELSHLAPDGRLIPSPLPATAEYEALAAGRVVARLAAPWTVDGVTHPAGALVAYRIAAVEAGAPTRIERVWTPGPTEAVQQVAGVGDALIVALLDDVAGHLLLLRPVTTGWARHAVPVPRHAALSIVSASADAGLALVNVETMTTPDALFAVRPDAPPALAAATTPQFDASAMTVEQRFATSRDGQRVPFFLVRPAGARGPLPTLIHAYGGFRTSQLPTYLGPLPRFWVESGGAYALANLRGGGEYGPAWHAAALREGRSRAFDDLHAVAEGLRRDGTSSAIAVSGRSNGGLLAAVAITQRPDLYQGALIGAPLADMRRYHRLLAGASWIAEYGDPDNPADWAFLRRYSPLHALTPGVRYPPALIFTSTRDDRVHPAHARKLAARLEELGQDFDYLEAPDGGHAGIANRLQEADRVALLNAWLARTMGVPPVTDAAVRAGGVAAAASAPE